MSTEDEIERYIRTGDCDMLFPAWGGSSIIDRCKRGHGELLKALVQGVTRLAAARPVPEAVKNLDLVAFTRGRVEPMVRGLFPKTEQGPVLALLERSVVFLTPENVENVLLGCHWLHTAWSLANLYLASVDAPLLGEKAPRIVGLSEETTCFVSAEYFTHGAPFADFVVHEVAHVFHNCKRRTVGLPETRRREWLLEIDFSKRETFAYACEAYARIAESSTGGRRRIERAAEYARRAGPSGDGVDSVEIVDIIRDAATVRNGWKTILARCAPVRRKRTPDEPKTGSISGRDLAANRSTPPACG